MSELNSIYIISKGRPQCHTAQTLEKMGYKDDWFIVCGNNDETLPEYQERWGDKVLIFDWHEEIKHTDTMDNFGFEKMASGACPARNATARISQERGERRHWQLDDDYTGFYGYDPFTKKNERLHENEFRHKLALVSSWADECGFGNVGFPPSTIEVAPIWAYTFAKRVFNAHNLPSGGELFEPWRGRMNDDLVNAINTWRHGKIELTIKFLCMTMPPTQQEGGGLTDLYKDEGTVRKTSYAILAAPNQVKMVEKYGRYHHEADWGRIAPKIVSDSYRRQ